MPPRKRKAAQAPSLQPISEADQEDKPGPLSVPEPDVKTAALAELKQEVERRVNLILTEGRELANAFRQEMQVAALKIPKKVGTGTSGKLAAADSEGGACMNRCAR